MLRGPARRWVMGWGRRRIQAVHANWRSGWCMRAPRPILRIMEGSHLATRTALSAGFWVLIVGACGSDFTAGPGTGNGGRGGSGATDCSLAGQLCIGVCDPKLGCVDCSTNDDCVPSAPICVTGSCEECGEASDCPSGQSCYPKDHECQPSCETSDDCSGDEAICDPSSGACVGCIDAGDCPGDAECSSTTKQCVECESDAACVGAEPICDLQDGDCRECLVDAHCPLAIPLCVNNNCEAEPSMCNPGLVDCGADGCVDTQSDPQHCGDCGTSCGSVGSCVGGECSCPNVAQAPGGDCPDQCTGGCDGATCVVDCDGDSKCEDDSITCPEDFDCEVQCGAKDSCKQASVACPSDYTCTVDCDDADRSCDNLNVACGDIGSCELTCGGGEACKNAQVVCGSNACSASCEGGDKPSVECGDSCGCTSC